MEKLIYSSLAILVALSLANMKESAGAGVSVAKPTPKPTAFCNTFPASGVVGYFLETAVSAVQVGGVLTITHSDGANNYVQVVNTAVAGTTFVSCPIKQ
jgi:hypothetical protein